MVAQHQESTSSNATHNSGSGGLRNESPPAAVLRNCPFCGSPNVEVRLYNQPSVDCHDCLCMGPAAKRLTKSLDNTEDCKTEAIKLWNDRPGSLITIQLSEWRQAALEAMIWLERGEPRRAFEILSQRFNS